ncbi:MAG TPA: substrate-binding domain-containing protein [Phycisphaerae bacterium]|nr:substrate-binding domain-containing protein [Phycisphaerae bacterium]
MGRPEMVGRIVDRLLQRLATGTWPDGATLPSIRHLAREFGVSFQTIMAATHRMAEWGLLSIRQRHAMRLSPGAAARARERLAQRMHGDRPRRLAILIRDFWAPPRHNVFYGSLVAAIQTEADRQGKAAEVVYLPVRQQADTAGRLLRSGYDGAVFLAFEAEYMASVVACHENGFPVLIFNRRISGLELPSVTFDGYSASRALVERLAELGHRNLCMVASHACHAEVDSDASASHGKTVGWVDALVKHGLFEHCAMPVHVTWDYSGIGLYDGAFRRIMRSPDRPTAILFYHSPLARRFLADPEFARLAVPAEISLATYEPATDMPHAPGRPPLTSINIDPHRSAQCILETLDKMIAGVPHPPTIRVPLSIQWTDSIGPP